MPWDNSWRTSDAGIFLRRQQIMSKIESWHETFFDGLYGKVLAELFNEEQSKKEARLVKYLARIRKGQSALDVPCGQGRLTFPLSDMGLVMTGVDRTQSYIRKARRVARDRELNLRYECADMREIEFEEEFDAAFNWFGSFGYFSETDNMQFLRRVYFALKPGGRFLIEGLNKSWLLSNFKPHREEEVAGISLTHRSRWDAKNNRIHDKWTMSRGDRQESHTITMRIYNGTEIRTILRNAGFADIQLCGYPALRRLNRHSPRWIAVANRPT